MFSKKTLHIIQKLHYFTKCKQCLQNILQSTYNTNVVSNGHIVVHYKCMKSINTYKKKMTSITIYKNNVTNINIYENQYNRHQHIYNKNMRTINIIKVITTSTNICNKNVSTSGKPMYKKDKMKTLMLV